MTEHVMKVPVTMWALIARINRRLAANEIQLKTARNMRMRLDVGTYYVVNTRINGMVQPYKDCDSEQFGRELGVLKA